MNISAAFIGAALATIAIGAMVALQPVVNSELGRRTTDLGAAFISVSVTFVLIAVLLVLFGDVGSVAKAREVPAIYLTGGVYGGLFVAVSLITVRALGAGLTVALLVAAQLIVAAVIDHLGVLGVDPIPLSGARVAGIAALLAGTALISLDA